MQACLHFMQRIDSLSTDASCRAALTEAAISMLHRTIIQQESHTPADSQVTHGSIRSALMSHSLGPGPGCHLHPRHVQA